MNHEHQSRNGSWLGTRRSIAMLVFLAIIAFFLFTKDRGYVFGGLCGFTLLSRRAEALAETKRARELDPFNLRTGVAEGSELINAGRPDEALVSITLPKIAQQFSSAVVC